MKRTRLAELRDAPGVGEPGEHLATPPRALALRPVRCLGLRAPRSLRLLGASWLGVRRRAAAASPSACFFFFFTFGSFSSVTVPPAASIFSRAVFENACAVTVSFFVSSPLPSILTSIFVFVGSARFDRALSGVTSAPASKRLEVADVDGLRGRPERADRHRVLRRLAAQLAEPHVDRHLAALEPGAHLVRARARLLALDAAAGVAALARAEAAADALAVLPRLRGLQGGEVELARPSGSVSSTFTRWRDLPQHACEHGLSLCSAVLPILPSPSARSVPRCRWLWPIWLRTWVILTFGPRSRLARPDASSAAGSSAADSRRRLGDAARPPRERSPGSRRQHLGDRSCRASARRPRAGAGCFRPSTVAFSMLIGFVVPRLFARMSRIPASSSTARTPPPAMTPVPSLAGRSRTRAASELAEDLVRDRRAVLRHREEVLLRVVDGLRDRERNLARLPVADADAVDLVADDDERREREPPAALDDLGDAVDLDHALLELAC